ncbi:MAG: DUF4405 domain-containing protein [Burkholderiaceae bacterium]|nr:DUF4405 domain-containing protein [Burkholderiaceae bacterium]
MKVSREWATPLTIGIFTLMAVTGILMFFHLDKGLNKTAHEWLGWLLVAGVAAHVIANWVGFKRHFSTGTTGRLIVVTCLIALAGSFFSLPGSGNEGIPPHILALKAVTKAPMTQVAALAGKPVEQVILDLAKAGINVSSPDANLQAVLQGDKGLEAKAMRAIFSPRS